MPVETKFPYHQVNLKIIFLKERADYLCFSLRSSYLTPPTTVKRTRAYCRKFGENIKIYKAKKLLSIIPLLRGLEVMFWPISL